jgi:hypothetical protein
VQGVGGSEECAEDWGGGSKRRAERLGEGEESTGCTGKDTVGCITSQEGAGEAEQGN